jgi:antitoxin ParD1/3/4
MDPQNAEKLSITLPPEMARLIREKVSSGAFGSNSEVIRTALRGWFERERHLAALDSSIARGIADADAGRVRGIDEGRTELRNKLARKGHSPA